MNEFKVQQSLKILSCYLEKGGRGSKGHRHRTSSIERVEDSNFSQKEENYQRLVSNQISKLSLDLEHNKRTIKKLEREITNQINAKTAPGAQMKNNGAYIQKLQGQKRGLELANKKTEKEIKFITNNFENE